MGRGQDSAGTARAAPAVVLLLLAPIVSEVLYGATRPSFILVLIPQIAIWGCGTLMIREAAMRCRRGWVGLLLLGMALAVAEECVIQQTSLAPMVGLAKHEYGRVLGVNWVYFLWALGYESVWVVVLPVKLAELIFPGRRDEPWVGRRGLILAGLAFLAGSFVAWYSWTQVARTKVFHMPEYRPPMAYLVVASVAIVLLVAAAFGPWMSPPSGRPRPGRPAPGPWMVGSIAFAFGLPWSVMVLLAYGTAPTIPFEATLIAGVAWVCAVFVLFVRLTSCPNWGDRHRYAVVCGGIVACMAGGFAIFALGALPIDWIGKVVLNAIAALWLARLGRDLAESAGRPHDLPPGPAPEARGPSVVVREADGEEAFADG
jgi:hypothetical protein